MDDIYDDEHSAEDILEETRNGGEEFLIHNFLAADGDEIAASKATDKHLPIDHPLNDSAIDPQEQYDEDF